MTRYLSTALIAAATVVGASAAAAQETGPGAKEFRQNCAVCHGLEGLGDGPMVQELTTQPKDLTRLAADNGGVFPFERVYRVIDG
jgi:mono/diheme cytochrome c family protein